MTEGVDAAIAEYRRQRREGPQAWDFSEQQLNQLGYALMNHGRTDDALAIFRLNVELFPESANPTTAWARRT